MEAQREPEHLVALFATLADAEATLHALQDAGVPYPDIRLGTHAPGDLDHATIAERTQLSGIALPERFWSLVVVLDPQWRAAALAVLHSRQPLALGRLPALDNRRDDTERGAIAWRHYVFETPAATDAIGEYAGTTGNTGVISSGAFADGARVEGNPPTTATPPRDERPSDAGEQPTSDTQRPETSTDRSRPETELKP
ncbi:MAG TPA: hypothetical protein VF897_22730 [Roseiflexaceae bacterium]